MAEFICPDQINRDYFTVDDNGLIIPKVYPTFTQVPENVVPTPYDSLALATAAALASPVTIIAEVVNTGNPSENGVYAIEPNGDTKKLDSGLTNKYSATGGGSASLTHTQTLNFKVNTDKTITEAQISGSDALIPYSPLRVDASNNVFTKAGDIYPVLSTATTEPMSIDTATGQIGRVQSYQYKNNVEGFININCPRNTKTQLFSIFINNNSSVNKDYIIDMQFLISTLNVELYNNFVVIVDIDGTQDGILAYNSCIRHNSYPDFRQYNPDPLTGSRTITLTPGGHTIGIMGLTNFSYSGVPGNMYVPYVVGTIHNFNS